MKTNRGKGYFYAMGQRDKALGDGWPQPHYLRLYWPEWGLPAYYCGFYGRAL